MSTAISDPPRKLLWAYSATQRAETMHRGCSDPECHCCRPPLMRRRRHMAVDDRTPPDVRRQFHEFSFLSAATRVVPGIADLFTGGSVGVEGLPMRHDVYSFGLVPFGTWSFVAHIVNSVAEHLQPTGSIVKVRLDGPTPWLTSSVPGLIEFTHPESLSVREYFVKAAAASNWMRQFNIVAPFASSAALRALGDRTDSRSPSERLLTAIEGIKQECAETDNWILLEAASKRRRNRSVLRTRPMKLDLPTWNPYTESEAHFKQRFDEVLAQASKQAIEKRDQALFAIKQELDRVRERPMPRNRRRGNVVPEMRYEWAALRQCSGKTIVEIADLYEEDSEVVRRATNRILDSLGFRTWIRKPLATLSPVGQWGE
jgi:hypothetical protein